MHRSTIAATATLLALVACGGSTPPRAAARTIGVASASPSGRVGDGCTSIEADFPQIEQLAQQMKGGKPGSSVFDDAVERLLYEFAAVGEVESRVRIDIQQHGPYAGGDRCLARIAEAEATIGTRVGNIGDTNGVDAAALTYELLVQAYPSSPEAPRARTFLRDHGYPIPTPS